MDTTTGNILFCGVGGQGILLASEITAYTLLSANLDVKKSEVHGMAQRGGSVVAHLRYGKKVFSPLIEPGTADFVVAFETMEAARYLPYMHENTKIIVNNTKIPPPSVATGKTDYPDNILDELAGKGLKISIIEGDILSRQAGEPRSANVVLVGALSTFLPFDEEIFIEVIRTGVKRKVEENITAFRLGRQACRETGH